MPTPHSISFSNDRAEAIASIESIAAGRGWCNVIPNVVDDVDDLKVNFLGLRKLEGVTVASFVTNPARHGHDQPSSLGVLHTRGRLGRVRIAELLDGATFRVTQDHNQRGLLLEVPVDTAASAVLEVMCRVTSALCDVAMTGSWRLDRFLRD